jgi:hypothetical protein
VQEITAKGCLDIVKELSDQQWWTSTVGSTSLIEQTGGLSPSRRALAVQVERCRAAEAAAAAQEVRDAINP